MIIGEKSLNKFLNHNSDLSQNRLYNLPYEVQLEIFAIKENEQVNFIISKWYWHLNKKILLAQKLISLNQQHNINDINFIDPTQINTVQVLYTCCKILNGRENIWWLQQLIYVLNGLIIYSTYTADSVIDVEPYHVDNFYKTEGLLEDLLVKFKIFQTKIDAYEYYFNLFDINNDILQHINSTRFNNDFNLNDIPI